MTDYKEAGVDAQKKEQGLNQLLEYVNRTFGLNPCKPLLPIGYFANVIDLRPAGLPIGIAFSTDGVGTKLLVAEMLGKYDTVGIDCVAMNVNDLLCVGAIPLSMVDYIAVSEAKPALLDQIGKGLYEGCVLAGVNLCGGEIAQVWELLAKKESGISFDIVGTAIGTVVPEKIIVGQDIQAGDCLIGLESNGLHSNGYTLARRALFGEAGYKVSSLIPDLGGTLGEELLRPTRIYVKEVLDMMRELPVKGLFHITGDGLFNLCRTSKAVGYRIESFPEPPPIFRLIQESGKISDAEMFRVFNMGVGFCIVIPHNSSHIEKARQIASVAGYTAHVLGTVTEDSERTIDLQPFRLIGRKSVFVRK